MNKMNLFNAACQDEGSILNCNNNNNLPLKSSISLWLYMFLILNNVYILMFYTKTSYTFGAGACD